MIQKYDVENKYFESKYGCKFREFQMKVENMKNEENFEWEDDLMDWEFVVENLRLWQNRVSQEQLLEV